MSIGPSAEQAVEDCDEAAFDVLVTDIRLPGRLTGWDIAERCREGNPDLPVIYVTGYSHERPRPVPGSVVFNKPYRPVQVAQAIRSLAVHTDAGAPGSGVARLR